MNMKIPLHRTFVLLCLLPGFSAGSAAQQANAPPGTVTSFHVSVSRILVPVVVRDAQGRVVTDLRQEDFQVFDNNKPHAISGFTVELHKPAEAPQGTGPAAPPPAALPSQSPPQRSIVFLFDDLHLNTEDLLQAKNAAAKVLAKALTPADMAAVVSLSGKTNSGLTQDPAKLQEALASLRPHGSMQSGGLDCPKIDYYQADLIETKHDTEALADAVRQVLNCSPGLDVKYNYNEAESLADAAAQRALNLGQQDIQYTYAAMADYVRRVSALPGQRMLVLVSPGFLPIEQISRASESRILDLAARSNVTISALDARGVFSTELGASEKSPSFSTLNGNGGSMQLQSGYLRESASLAQDSMAELADGTGGTFIHDSNDLNAAFQSLTEPPACVYLLELEPETAKPDGSLHRLKVKLDRGGLEIQARRGYTLSQPMSATTDVSLNGDEVHLALVVRDKKNRPISGLKPGEIAVTDDDAPVTLDNFRLVDGKDKSQHLVTLLFDRPPPARDSHQVVAPPELNEPREIAERILRIFPKSGFSFSVMDVQGRLQLQQRFTTDRKVLEQAIERATQPAESGAAALTREEQDLMAVARTVADSSGAVASGEDRTIARELFSALSNSSRIVQDQHLQPPLAALLALAQSLREVAGRKAILYFSSAGDTQADSRSAEAIDPILSAANRAEATMYMVDFNHVDSVAARMETSAMSMNGPENGRSTGAKAANVNLGREAASSILQKLAEGSGGSYIVAEDDISSPAKQVIEDMTTYYEASYLPSIEDYDGKFRQIAVKPLRDGLTVRSQAGYLALPSGAGATLRPFELPLIKILGQSPLPTDLAFRSAILHMEDTPEGSVNTLAIDVPLSALEVHEDANTNLSSAHVAIVASIKDSTGAVVAHFSEDIPWRATATGADRAKIEAIALQRHFIAPPGNYVLEAAILDCNRGKAGAERVSFEIPAASGTPSLSGLVLVSKAVPFRAADDPSEPMQHGSARIVPNLSGTLPPGAKEFAMFFIAHVDPNAPQPATIGIRVFRDGKLVEGAPAINQQARKATFSSYLANLFIDPPKDGVYEVRATLTQSGKTAEARAQLVLAGVEPRDAEETTATAGTSRPPVSGSSAGAAKALVPDPDAETGLPAPPPREGALAIIFPAHPIQPPSQDELTAILADATQIAMDYGSRLPNFVCEQVTARAVDAKNNGHWKQKDKATELLTYVDHHEERSLLVLEHYGAKKHTDTEAHTDSGDREGTVSAGEFGAVLVSVFRPESKASFQWKGTGVLGDGTVQVFDYTVAKANSILNVGVRSTTGVGCHGQVFIDSATRGVRRITMVADDVPKDSRLNAASVSVDYDYVAINDHDYLLPVSAQILVTYDRRRTDLNQIDFRNFHRFSSTAKILPNVAESKP